MNDSIHIVGGGLAGSEAAWQLARRGVRVRLSEMRGVEGPPAPRPAVTPGAAGATASSS